MGVPLVLPATDARWTWDFGDGAARIATREPAHTYYRAGTFVVRAFAGTRELARTRVEVSPRGVDEALPAGTWLAVWVEGPEPDFERAVDGLERLAGTTSADTLLTRWILPRLVLEWRAEAPARAGPLDPDDAVGVLRLEGYDGAVAFAGVSDADQAQRAVLAALADRGGVAASHPGGGVQVTMPGGDVVGVLLDRGYLYVAVPSLPAGSDDPDLAAIARGPEHDPAPVFAAVRALPDGSDAARGPLELPWTPTVRLLFTAGDVRWRGGARVSAEALELEAFAATAAPAPADVGEPPALGHAGAEPPPVIGSVGLSPRWLLPRVGLRLSDELEALLHALGPSAVWTAEPTSAGGALHLDGRCDDAERVRTAAQRLAASTGGTSRAHVEGDRVELQLRGAPRDRSPSPLLQAVQGRHGDGAFGGGHVSVEVDGVALRAAARAGRTLRLPPPVEGTWATVDRLFLDVAAEPQGLRARARLELRAE